MPKLCDRMRELMERRNLTRRELAAGHVEVAVFRKFCAKSVGWLAGASEPYAVRHNDKEFAGVERLAFAIKLIDEAWREEFFACSIRAVNKKNGVVDNSARAFMGRPESYVMDFQFRQRLTAPKPEILGDKILFSQLDRKRWRILCEEGRGVRCDKEREAE